jgi:hypothetical protein
MRVGRAAIRLAQECGRRVFIAPDPERPGAVVIVNRAPMRGSYFRVDPPTSLDRNPFRFVRGGPGEPSFLDDETADTPTAPTPLPGEGTAVGRPEGGTTVSDNPTHRPAHMTYGRETVTVVADLAERPELLTTGVDPRNGQAAAVFRAGPLRITFDDPKTAELWASALMVTTAELELAQEQADKLAARPEGSAA